MDWEKDFSVSNHSGMRVIFGSLDIADGTDSFIIEPYRYGEQTINVLKDYEKRKIIKVTNDFTVPSPTVSITEEIGVMKVQSVANEEGDKHNHYVFDPFSQNNNNKSFSVQEIDMSKGYTEEAIDTIGKGIVVNEPKPTAESEKMSRVEAVDLLGIQWKKFEIEINKIEDLRKLNFIQIIAIEEGVTGKKREIIDNRIKAL